MNPKINFTPGPSQLYFTVEDHIRTLSGKASHHYRTEAKNLKAFYQDTVEGLRELLKLPSDYHIYFTGSATEIWERTIQNLVEEKSFHLVNGSFSKRFFEIAVQLGKKPVKNEVGNGKDSIARF